jgi:heme exporter protein C
MKIFRWVWLALTLGLLGYGFYQGMYVAPTEATMGDIQRIFYYHFPSAMMAFLFFFVSFVASIVYLASRRNHPQRALAADAAALAGAEMGIVFCTLVLIQRLTTTLVLWLIYVSYLLLRKFADGPQMQTLAAVVAIFGYVDVPIVYYSTTWWRTQHPAPVISGDGSLDPAMWTAVLWNLAAWLAWGIMLAGWRYSIERRRQIAEQHAALHALEASLEVTL